MPDPCDPMDCSLPGSSVHGIVQARILEWVAISFSKSKRRHRLWGFVRVSECVCGMCVVCGSGSVGDCECVCVCVDTDGPSAPWGLSVDC